MRRMTEAEAIEIATAHVIASVGRELRLIGANDRTWKRKNLAQGPSEWDVLFEAITSAGTVLEGAIIVTVDENTKRAQLREGPL